MTDKSAEEIIMDMSQDTQQWIESTAKRVAASDHVSMDWVRSGLRDAYVAGFRKGQHAG